MRPTARRLEANLDPAACYPRELIRRADELGLRLLKVPREHGGLGADCLTEVVVLEELCTGDCGFGMTLQHAWREGWGLSQVTTPEQRERYLRPFLDDPTAITSLAMSEPEVGTDIGAGYAGDLTPARARPCATPATHWVLNGQKRWITNGINAQIFFVVARSDRSVPWPEGITVFLVPTDAPGLAVTKVEDKIGLRTNMNCEVLLEDATILKGDLVGEWNRGREVLHAMGSGAKAKTAAKSLGIARAAYEEALAFASASLRVDQRTDDLLATLAIEIEATRTLMWRAAWSVDHDRGAAPDLERMAFTKAADVCVRADAHRAGAHGSRRAGAGARTSRSSRATPWSCCTPAPASTRSARGSARRCAPPQHQWGDVRI